MPSSESRSFGVGGEQAVSHPCSSCQGMSTVPDESRWNMNSLNSTLNLYGTPVTPDVCTSYCAELQSHDHCGFDCCLFW